MISGFELEGVAVCYGSYEALRIETLALPRGGFVAIVGPNGAGKSTLLSVLAGLREEFSGSCRFDGREVRDWPRRELSRQVAFVPQSVDLHFPFTALDVAMMGRTPCTDRLFASEADAAIALQSLGRTGCALLAARDFRTLSGGEKQRVVLAAALAQQAQVLLLDEPTANLDPKHQLAVFEMLAALRSPETLTVIATHDLRLARRFCSLVVVLDKGRAVSTGEPRDSLRPEIFARVFEVDPGLWLGA